MKRVGIYIRVSTEEQARIQDGSLVSQKNRLLEYIEFQNKREANWGTLVEIYCDEGKSAKNMKGRPEFLRMLTEVKMGRINLIVATELSRLNRNIKDFCEVWDLLKDHKASFVTLRENFDTTTASGEMMVFNLINYAQYERKQTSERISANWLSRSKRGLWNGGTIPLGYDRNPINKAELAVNEIEAASVRKIFEVFLEKETVRKTQAAITELGIRNKSYTNKHGLEKGGKAFSVDTLQSLLTNKVYIGIKELRHKDGKREDIKAVWPAIVDKDIFQKVQERLAKNKNRYKPDSWKVYPFPLTELVQCGECGKSLGGKSGTGRKEKHHYYGHAQIKNPFTKETVHQCQVKNVRAPRLEEIITKSLRNLLTDPSFIEKWIDIYRSKTSSELPEVQNRTKQLDQEIQNVTKKINNLVQRVSELPSEVPAGPFYEQIKQLNQKLNDAKLAKEKLKTKEMDLHGQDIDQEGLKAKIKRTLNNLENVPKEKQRPIFTNLVKLIEIHPMKIKIGMYAPTKEQYKATGTDGTPSPVTETQNLNEIKEGKLIPFSPTQRVGSSTVGIGARRGT
ncbi:MAG: recombinase family protein [Bdellovibrionaceae bacterium]|nr:recombinase family protein [Pseudobdellovibrionaceae bacterium]